MNTTHFKKLERMYLQANVNTMVLILLHVILRKERLKSG